MTGPPPDPARDDELALRARSGDPRALAILYGRYAPPLLGYLQRLLHSRPDAEDALHESFLRLFEGRGRYRARGRFREWLFTVATGVARDRLRKTARRERIVTAAGEELAAHPEESPEERVVARDLAARVESALRDLPESYAAAFLLRVREEFSYREMAAITGEPEGTLRSRVHHALGRVRRALAEREGFRLPTERSEER